MVIVGCGFGGLFAAKALRRADVDVTVIDRTNHHLFQPLLYQLSTGILSEGDIAPPIRDILRKQANADIRLGEVTGINAASRQLTVRTRGQLAQVPYDSLIVATGAGSSYFGHDEYSAFAPGMKSIDDALELRGRIFGAFEMAALEQDAGVRRAWMTFVVVGAGPTGVEMAGQIAELAHRSLGGNFRTIDPADARVLLFDGGARVLPAFPELLQRKTLDALKGLGVEVHLDTLVTDVDAQAIHTTAGDPALARVEAFTKIWAAGVEASPLGRLIAHATGAQVDRAGRVLVEADCSLAGHPEIFVVGDLMSLDDLPGLAEVAMQSGVHSARTIVRRLRGDNTTRPFRYRDLGSMATISRFRAVATIGPIRAWGFVGWVLWLVVHLTFLTGFKNRVAVVFNWTIAFIGRGRPQRALTERQIVARYEEGGPPPQANAPG